MREIHWATALGDKYNLALSDLERPAPRAMAPPAAAHVQSLLCSDPVTAVPGSAPLPYLYLELIPFRFGRRLFFNFLQRAARALGQEFAFRINIALGISNAF